MRAIVSPPDTNPESKRAAREEAGPSEPWVPPPSDRQSLRAILACGPLGFAARVLAAFRRNQGMLLSGAVAYYMLLSIIPLMLLLLVGLSKLVPEPILLAAVREELDLFMPGMANTVADQLEQFLVNRHLIGWLGFGVLIFFSTMAFTLLENAMSVIFFHRVAVHRRCFLVSALIPFLFIALIGFGLLFITFAGAEVHQ